MVELRPVRTDDLDWLVERHATLYAAEAGFDASFGTVVRAAAQAFLADHDPAREVGWIAWDGGRRIGSLFVARDGDAARLRLFLLEPDQRGLGQGRGMLDRALRFAADAGYARVVVSTFDRHRAACALYEAAGFTETGRLPAQAFGQEMVERRFARVASALSPD